MFGYSKNKYYKGQRSYTPYKRTGYYRGSTKARAYGAAKAAKSGTKLDYFNCTVNGVATVKFEENAQYCNCFCFYPSSGGVSPTTGIITDGTNGNVYGGIVNNREFRSKCCSYDEWKLVSMKVKLQPVLPDSGTQYTVYSISDRCSSSEETNMDDSSMDDIEHDVPSTREIAESSGSLATTINTNRISPIIRYISSKDLIEKSTYSDCTISYTEQAGVSPLAALSFHDDPAFNPAIYFAVKSNKISTSEVTLSWIYTVEYNCIFRNPKSDLQTFIAKENPTAVNRSVSSRYTEIPSDDPYLPNRIIDSSGKELKSSIYLRQKIAYTLRKSKLQKQPTKTETTETKTIQVMPEEIKPTEKTLEVTPVETKPSETTMDVEDNPGTS